MYQARIDLEKNPDFLNCDLKDELEVFDKENQMVIFRGLIKNYSRDVNHGFIIAQDLSLKLETTRIGGAVEFINMNPADTLLLMTSSIEIQVIHNLPINIEEREFVIIMPIKNLIINGSFKIGDVEFYQDFHSKDDELIRKSSNGLDNKEWNGNYPRARIIIIADQFFSAIKKGYSKISSAIDLIALRTDLSFPVVRIGDSENNLNFSYYNSLSKVNIPSTIYCRERYTDSFTIFNMEMLMETILALEFKPQNYFIIINKMFDHLITKGNNTQEEKNLPYALHWLRMAIQSKDNKDKLLDLWTAMEFLMAKKKIKNLFSHSEIEKINNLIESHQEVVYR